MSSGYKYNIRNKGSYIQIIKAKIGVFTYQEVLDKIDFNNYWILKKSDKIRFLDEINEKYSGFILFDKKVYTKEYIQKWLDFIYNDNLIQIKFLSKPFPPDYILNKIKKVYEI